MFVMRVFVNVTTLSDPVRIRSQNGVRTHCHEGISHTLQGIIEEETLRKEDVSRVIEQILSTQIRKAEIKSK